LQILSPSVFYFNDDFLEKVATLLSEGETKESICKKLGITRGNLNKQISRLRGIYGKR
jgi:biotin operon repressor